ncbi:GLPGLI family protein [Croceiramulus getboli]|nr:GLPGLI family protein [Flavobacteriaceae bacterium YJPT1-3]
MKNLMISLLVIAFLPAGRQGAKANLTAQQFKGTATYQSQQRVDIKMDSTMGDELQRSIQEQLRRQFQRTYTLNFDDKASLWKEEATLDKPDMASASGFKIVVSGNQDELYKNIKEKRYVRQSDMMGKVFLIKDSLEQSNWEFINETKNIGQYTCFKAVRKDTITTQHLEDGDEAISETKEERITTAWYTLDIPLQHGPDQYWGCPGLILEINSGDLSYMCTKIVLNPEGPLVLEAPEKGKVVDEATYLKISDEKAKEMMERYSAGKKRGKDSKSFSIRIGG